MFLPQSLARLKVGNVQIVRLEKREMIHGWLGKGGVRIPSCRKNNKRDGADADADADADVASGWLWEKQGRGGK